MVMKFRVQTMVKCFSFHFCFQTCGVETKKEIVLFVCLRSITKNYKLGIRFFSWNDVTDISSFLFEGNE